METRRYDVVWGLWGLAVLLGIVLLVFHFRADNPAAQAAARAWRHTVVAHMRAALSAAAAAEKAAVMAVKDDDARQLAEEALRSTKEVERMRGEIEPLLKSKSENQLFEQFSKAFFDYQRIDRQILALAGRNTGRKASALTVGPAAQAIVDMDRALAGVIADHATRSPKVAILAAQAQIGAMRIANLLPPHLAEDSDERLREIEARIAAEDTKVRAVLSLLATTHDSRQLQTARDSYAHFIEAQRRIVELSRDNTDRRSLALSLNQKLRLTALCEGALSGLELAIDAEIPTR